MTTAAPFSSARSRIASAPSGSSCEVGSSSSRSCWLERERGRQAHPLELAGREGLDAARREVLRADGGERRMGPWEDLGRRRAEVLEPECHLVLDPVEDDLVLRVLEQRGHRAGELGRPLQSSVAAGDLHLADEAPAVEVRDKAGERPQKCRFPRPGGPKESDDVARLELKGHCIEGGLDSVRIGEAERADLD